MAARAPFRFSRTRRDVKVLTKRYQQCITLMVAGFKAREIADRLGINKARVNFMLRDSCRRTECRTREQLAAWWAIKQFRSLTEGKAA